MALNTFPSIASAPLCDGFRDEPSADAVLIASTASGYPLLNKLFTFDPRTFRFDLRFVSQTDKENVLAFYEANKDVPFLWTNGQDHKQYEVAFVARPGCALDGLPDVWRIGLELRQTTPI